MKKRRTSNTRLTSEKERRKQVIIKSVVKRGRRVTWKNISRWVGRVVKVLLLVGLVGGVYWGATEGYRRLFWENPDYALKEIRFTPTGSITRDQVITTTGFEIGRNIFSYNLDAARDALKGLPQVETVELRRYLPNRIEISLSERRPVAWVSAQPAVDVNKVERTHLIDERGMVFQPKRILPEYQPLPVIFGVPLEDMAPGKPFRVAEVMSSLELLQRVRESGEFKIVSMDVSKGYCINVLDQKGTRTTFGLDDLPAQLQRLAGIRREAGLIGQDLKSVNVMVARNVPVTFMPPPVPDHDLEELLREPGSKDAASSKAKTSPGEAEGKTNKSSPKKSEPSRTKEPARRDGEPVLRPFRRV